MKYALVGNNDGPLRLLNALRKAQMRLPVFIGLQKTPDTYLLSKYRTEAKDIPLKINFGEDDLIQLLTPYDPEVLINCFCNFKFVKLLTNYRCYNVHPSYL
ncbi:MAG: hypothetical protein WA951_06730, partial [Leeuwenhoekiella sp.]